MNTFFTELQRRKVYRVAAGYGVVACFLIQFSPVVFPIWEIYAGLGRCEEAMTEGKRAVELLPETKDAFDDPILTVSLARISVRCGDTDTALGILERPLGIPAGITMAELRFDPTWDRLRNHPRFQQMLAKHGDTD